MRGIAGWPRSSLKVVVRSSAAVAAIAVISMLCPVPGEARGFFSVRGGRLLDGSGIPVALRGLNVEFKGFATVLGETDIRGIAAMGANSIRLNLDYRDLEAAPYRYSAEGLALLDRVLEWCETYGLSVILDLHLAPGRQNRHDFVVHRESTFLFWEGSEFQERFYALWSELAGRYADRRVVAGYDLLNEGAPPTVEDYRRVMNAAAARIRARDKNHVLFVEEAILPDGTKELVLVKDPDTVYSVHFFYPPAFTFYATTPDRPITAYPGEMVAAGDRIAETRSAPARGDGGWRQLEVCATPPEGSEILVVRIMSGENRGNVWFDDVRLDIDGTPLDLPAPLVRNESFEIDYPGFNWRADDSCARISTGIARTGERSLLFSGCQGSAAASSSPLRTERGSYALTAWHTSEDASGSAYVSLAWHKKRVVSTVDKTAVQDRLEYALAFRRRHGVPLHVGEFTAHHNPSAASSRRYLEDLLELMETHELHWSFWEYYSDYPGVGLLTGAPPRVINTTAFDVLTGNLRK